MGNEKTFIYPPGVFKVNHCSDNPTPKQILEGRNTLFHAFGLIPNAADNDPELVEKIDQILATFIRMGALPVKWRTN